MFQVKFINCVPAYSTNAAKLLASALAFGVIKHGFQIHIYGVILIFQEKKPTLLSVFDVQGIHKYEWSERKLVCPRAVVLICGSHPETTGMQVNDHTRSGPAHTAYLVKLLSPSPLY